MATLLHARTFLRAISGASLGHVEVVTTSRCLQANKNRFIFIKTITFNFLRPVELSSFKHFYDKPRLLEPSHVVYPVNPYMVLLPKYSKSILGLDGIFVFECHLGVDRHLKDRKTIRTEATMELSHGLEIIKDVLQYMIANNEVKRVVRKTYLCDIHATIHISAIHVRSHNIQ